MNRALVLRLIMKDWYLNGAALLVIALAGSLSIGVLYLRGETTAFLGFSAALNSTIWIS